MSNTGQTYRRLVTGALMFALIFLLGPVGTLSVAAQDTTSTPVVVKVHKRSAAGAAQGIPVLPETAEELGLKVKTTDTGGQLVLLPKGSAAVIRQIDWEGSANPDEPRGPAVYIYAYTSTPTDLWIGRGYDGVGTHDLNAWTSKDLTQAWPSLQGDACEQMDGVLTGSLGETVTNAYIMIPGNNYPSLEETDLTSDYHPICEGLDAQGQ